MIKDYRFLLLLLASGCTDLSAVRDFANSSSQIAASETVISGWRANYDAAHQVALSSEMRKADPGRAKQLEQAAADAEKYTPVAEKAAQTLSLYLQTLALLADDKLPDVSSQAESIDKKLVALKVESSNTKGLAAKGSTGTILKLLEIPLDAWRQTEVRDLILRSDKDVQIITEFLATTADTVNTAEKVAGSTLTEYYEVSSIRTGDSGVRALLRRAVWEEDASVETARQQAVKATAAFTAIGKDHAVLAKNAKDLSNAAVKATLASDAPLLQNTLKLFSNK